MSHDYDAPYRPERQGNDAPRGPTPRAAHAEGRAADAAKVVTAVDAAAASTVAAVSAAEPTSEQVLGGQRWRERAAVTSWSGGAPASSRVVPGDARASASGTLLPNALTLEPEAPLRRRLLRAVSVPVVAGTVVFLVAIVVAISFTVVQVGETASLATPQPTGLAQTLEPETSDAVANATQADGVDAAESGGADPGAADASGQGSAHTPGVADGSGTAVFVHVVGEIVRPGVVELSSGSRVADAITAAGGATDSGVLSAVNLARVVADGEQILVPNAEQAAQAASVPPPGPSSATGDASGSTAPSEGAVVNLNTADSAQLETLPRIGPALAQRIIDWRDANGGFASVDQLLEVSGVGAKTLEAFRDRVTV